MKTITIQINMVSPRCIHVVKKILRDFNISYREVDPDNATLNTNPFTDFDLINEKHKPLDLERIRDQNELLIAEINKAIHCYMENISCIGHRQKLSDYISKEVARNYPQLSKVYSQYSGITIEQYFIDLRTNKVKVLIRQGKLNFSQIAITVGYSGIHYLSGQFRKYTGLSLSEYKMKWEEEAGKPTEKVNHAGIRRLISMRPGYAGGSKDKGDRRFPLPNNSQKYGLTYQFKNDEDH